MLKSSSNCAELDDLLNEILCDQAFQNEFSRLCIRDEQFNRCTENKVTFEHRLLGGASAHPDNGDESVITRNCLSLKHNKSKANDLENSKGKWTQHQHSSVPEVQFNSKFKSSRQSPSYNCAVMGENNNDEKDLPFNDSYDDTWTDYYRKRSPTYHGAPLSSYSGKFSSKDHEDHNRSWASDSEDTLSWLDHQRNKLKTKQHAREVARRNNELMRTNLCGETYEVDHSADLKTRTKKECQLVEELKVAQSKLCKSEIQSDKSEAEGRNTPRSQIRGRTPSNGKFFTKEEITKQALLNELHNNFKKNGIGSDTDSKKTNKYVWDQPVVPAVRVNGNHAQGSKESENGIDGDSSRCKTEKNYFVSGMEQPPFTTHQTKYFFSMSKPQSSMGHAGKEKGHRAGPPVPQRSDSAGSRSTPATPIRGPSSREAMKQSKSFDWAISNPSSKLPDTDPDEFNFDNILQQLDSFASQTTNPTISNLTNPLSLSGPHSRPSNSLQSPTFSSRSALVQSPSASVSMSHHRSRVTTSPSPAKALSPTKQFLSAPLSLEKPSINTECNSACTVQERDLSFCATQLCVDDGQSSGKSDSMDIRDQPSLDEILEEVIMLRPVGRGLHNVESNINVHFSRNNSLALGSTNNSSSSTLGAEIKRESNKCLSKKCASQDHTSGRKSAQLCKTHQPVTAHPSVSKRSHSADILQHGRPIHGVTHIDEWKTMTSSIRRQENDGSTGKKKKSVDFGFLGTKDDYKLEDVLKTRQQNTVIQDNTGTNGTLEGRPSRIDKEFKNHQLNATSTNFSNQLNILGAEDLVTAEFLKSPDKRNSNKLLQNGGVTAVQSHAREYSMDMRPDKRTSNTCGQDEGFEVVQSQDRKNSVDKRLGIQTKRKGGQVIDNFRSPTNGVPLAKSTPVSPVHVSHRQERSFTTSPVCIRTPLLNGTKTACSPNTLTSPSDIRPSHFGNDMLSRGRQTPCFVKDSSKYWHKPRMSRDGAICFLKNKSPGTFVVRNSNSFPGAFGLAMKVARLPPNVHTKGGDLQAELVRHFLIEPTAKGVRLKGCSTEPVFGSLAALVYQHTLTALSLPSKLVLPVPDDGLDVEDETINKNPVSEALEHGAACSVLYLNSVDMESLTGPEAISRAVRTTLTADPRPSTTVVHFKVTGHGITLTDNIRRLFFRRHYHVDTVTYCGVDPDNRRWTWINEESKMKTVSKVFGFVARKQGYESGNTCHIFAELDPEQPADAIVNFIMKIMLGFHRGHRQ